MTYAEKLLDKRWLARRSEILERDDFTCQRCFSYRCTLQVHHLHYYPLHDPWEYDDDDLITLCADCHGAINVHVPKEEIINPWLAYERAKKRLEILSPAEYDRAILDLGNRLSL